MINKTITCPNCSSSILLGEKKCSHCGSKKHKGLILCESCNGQFYKEAKTCPHCGATKHRNALRKHPILSMLLICTALTFLVGLGDGDQKRVEQASYEPSKSQLINSIDFQYETYKGKYKENPGLAINVKFNNKSDWNIRILGITCANVNSIGEKYNNNTAKIFFPIPAKTPHFKDNLSMDDLPIPKDKSESYSCEISDAERY